MKLIPISHKKPECIGCALCAEVAPNYFDMDEDGEAQLIRVIREQGKFQFSEGFEEDREALEAAEEGCPVDIIKIG
ncbi:ferredoxin [Coraliomargarita akajimensis]|uniref:Ferredoxin n=1 Tax=Coraliomargarita akajimensis (strain DSM 45221 / IAM 15411 / JCM 23193 / KCTC 12865 / 04OKA010-24) TaxID=583355 RepID=D5EQR5_CORAD|nr:ferredoxin [Coraliomargarita akajimensis]ADE55879.1 ferredoxin [Coraliomargarita akajimensis DSM 45221]